jgi:cytochrome c-type biogenesis protein
VALVQEARITMAKTAIVALFAVLVLVVAGGAVVYNLYINVKDTRVKDAPLFKALDIDETWCNLSANEGKITILDFAYFCEETCDHCKQANLDMFDVLESLKAHYAGDLEVWVIDMTPDSTDQEIRTLRDRYNITLPMINDYFEGSNANRNFTGTEIGALYYEYFMAGGYIANPTILIIDQSLRVRMVYQVTVVTLGQYTDNQKPTESELRGVLDKGMDYDWPSKVGGRYVSSGVQLVGMFVMGMFVSVTPCAFSIFLAMTTFILSTKDRGKRKKRRKKGPLQMMDEPLHEQVLGSNEVYGGLIGLAFTLGIGAVFFILGITMTFVVGYVKDNRTLFEAFFIVAGVIIIFMGINNLHSITLMIRKLIQRFKKADPDSVPTQTFFDTVRLGAMSFTERYAIPGAFLLGAILALGWAPCILTYVFPIYIMISTQQMHWLMGGVYMFVMALGFGVPIILVSAMTLSLKAEYGSMLMGIGKVVRIILCSLIIVFGVYLIFSTVFPQYSLSVLLGL